MTPQGVPCRCHAPSKIKTSPEPTSLTHQGHLLGPKAAACAGCHTHPRLTRKRPQFRTPSPDRSKPQTKDCSSTGKLASWGEGKGAASPQASLRIAWGRGSPGGWHGNTPDLGLLKPKDISFVGCLESSTMKRSLSSTLTQGANQCLKSSRHRNSTEILASEEAPSGQDF